MTSPPTGGVTPPVLHFPCAACAAYTERTGKSATCSACQRYTITDPDPTQVLDCILVDDARPAIDTWDAPTFAGRLPDPVVVPHDVWVELSSLVRSQVAAVVPSAPVKLAHYARGYRDASVEVLKLLQRIEAQQAALMPPLGDQ